MKFELDNVELSFDGKQILYGVYVKAEKGIITGILGSNGCGKTSLLRIFFGNLKANNALVRIDGKGSLKALYRRTKVKYLSQQNYFPGNIRLTQLCKFHRLLFSNFQELFPEFKSHQKQKFRELSGGEQRLFSIWLTLKTDVHFVLLDEPFTHLSPIYVDRVKEILVEQKAKKAILITDHMYKHILDLSDELYLIQNGCSKKITAESELAEAGYIKSF